jgi:SdpI/YfhL protein family
VKKAIKLGLSGVIMVTVGRMSAAERLPRNILAGIRIPSTLRSDEAWRAGHKAAAAALTVAGLGPIVAAAVVGVKARDEDSEKLVARIGTAWLLGWLGLATVQARRAARTTVGR